MQGEGEVPPDREMGEKSAILRYVADLAGTGLHPSDVFARNPHDAPGRLAQTAEDLEEGGLTTARFPHEDGVGIFREFEGNVLQLEAPLGYRNLFKCDHQFKLREDFRLRYG